MSRPVDTRFIIAGTLVADTPIHIGGINGNPATDMPLSVNGLGELYVPGTSLAGPLRHWLMARFPDEIDAFWGRIPVPTREKRGDQGHASYVTIDDAPIKLPPSASAEIRDGVGIDREYGTAADGIKFDREILPKGTEIALRMTVDCPLGASGAAEMRALVEALMQGEIRLGAAKTRGLGKVRLDEGLRIERFDLRSPTGILSLLARTGREQSGNQGCQALGDAAKPKANTRVRIAIEWRPLGPVMVKASGDGNGVDIVPLVTASGAGGAAPVIPGSSSKGALRQQSERILATVLGCNLAEDETKQRFVNQLARLPLLIETLYGAVKKKVETKVRSGRGALSIDDCLAKVSRPAADWSTIADAWEPMRPTKNPEGEVAASVAASIGLDVAAHVAIDRWTGGAADGALFTAAEPRLAWDPLLIEVDVARLFLSAEKKSEEKRAALASIALLLLTLKDMVDGLVPLGFGVNRGYGDIDTTSVTIDVVDAAADSELSELGALVGLRIEKQNGRAEFRPEGKLDALDKAWVEYLAAYERPESGTDATQESPT